ncbi:MAG: cache domain-containing protein [Bacteriovoracaceae bacterium]|nr:cache domain-containing protein [Bacteriovoracaceae bacterium]
MKDALIKERQHELQDVVSTVIGALNTLKKQVDANEISETDAKKFASQYIRSTRYGRDNKDYLWVNDFDHRMLFHPKSSLEGKIMSDFKDVKGKKIFVEMVTLAKAQKSGFIDYWWPSVKDPKKISPKLSFINTFEPWGWIIGTGVYLDDVDEYAMSMFMQDVSISIGSLILLALFVTLIIRTKVVAPLLNIAQNLRNAAVKVMNSSEATLETSQNLSKGTHDQAASLQETVSSIDEISAMIDRNTDSARKSKETSYQSQEAAKRGKKTIDEMLESISVITENNTNTVKRIEHNNKQVGDILGIIKEIEDKTKVINDIVFQTKLLSFNASVEAARAGESGKGFAVVAEEVGNLANMSGKASEEITSLLDRSISQVEEIVTDAKKMSDIIIKEGSTAIESGTKKASDCKEALDNILGNVVNVDEEVNQIAQACDEQSSGVGEITKAMRLLDQVTHQNTADANKASHAATMLKDQADELDSVVENVLTLVHGESKNKVA